MNVAIHQQMHNLSLLFSKCLFFENRVVNTLKSSQNSVVMAPTALVSASYITVKLLLNAGSRINAGVWRPAF